MPVTRANDDESWNGLSPEFIDALHAEFVEHGAAVLRKLCRDNPLAFIRLVVEVTRDCWDAAPASAAGLH